MKLTFKDLKQQKFTIEAEPSDTVADVKSKINAEKGWETSTLKLIYSGKILQDANSVESYSIQEKDFIVCMVSKPKVAPTAASSSSKPSTPAPAPVQTPSAPAPVAAAATATATDDQAPATPSPAPAAPAPSGEDGRFDNPSQLMFGPQRQAAIANMESMGFPRAEIERAMRAAYYNPDRAVEYLLNGIPESAQQDTAPPQRQTPTSPTPATTGSTQAASNPTPSDPDAPINLFEAAAQQGQQGGRGSTGTRAAPAGGGAGSEGATGGAGDLSFLRDNPQFQQLRQVIMQQPQMLEQILQQLSAGNPQLAQMIQSNPEQFMRLLAEEHEGDDMALPPGAQTISVTSEEQEAIERLCRLGFERDLVIQAYFACDKNEELAANFLFDQPDDGDEQ